MIIGNERLEKPFEDLIIIDKDLWLEATEIANSMRQSRGKYKPDDNFLLDGLLFCSKCNAALKSRIKEMDSGETIKLYSCQKHSNVYFLTEDLENIILEKTRLYAVELVNNHWEVFLKDGLRKLEGIATSTIKGKSKIIDTNYEKAFNLVDSWIQSDNPEQTKVLHSQLISSYDQIDTAEKELQAIRSEENHRLSPFKEASEVMDLITDFDIYKYLRNKPDSQLRHLINSVIEQVIVDRDGVINEIIMKSPFYMNDKERRITICQ